MRCVSFRIQILQFELMLKLRFSSVIFGGDLEALSPLSQRICLQKSVNVETILTCLNLYDTMSRERSTVFLPKCTLRPFKHQSREKSNKSQSFSRCAKSFSFYLHLAFKEKWKNANVQELQSQE